MPPDALTLISGIELIDWSASCTEGLSVTGVTYSLTHESGEATITAVCPTGEAIVEHGLELSANKPGYLAPLKRDAEVREAARIAGAGYLELLSLEARKMVLSPMFKSDVRQPGWLPPAETIEAIYESHVATVPGRGGKNSSLPMAV